MNNISVLGVILSLILIFLFLSQVALLIRVINKKKKNKIFKHLLGTAATFLISVFTVAEELKYEINSSFLVILTVILAVLFFITASIDSLKVEKTKIVK